MRKTKLTILIIFFASGATGLIYEVIWTRMLILVFGSTVFAVTTVLTSFMAGLALGSFYFGRRADAQARPLRIYAYLEIGIGIFALIFPIILILLNGVYVGIHRQIHASFYPLSLIRFVLSFLVLLVPTTLMGATLPIISKFFVLRFENLGWDVGRLYSLNTFGAVVGTIAAGFFLVKWFGVDWTLRFSAVINLIIAGIAMLLDKQKMEEWTDGRMEGTHPSIRPSNIPSSDLPPLIIRLALWTFAVSGFCALAYEVLWTRILVFFLGHTTYAFATMLSAFLFGIAAGSFIFAKIADLPYLREKIQHQVSILGVVQISIGLSAIVLLPAFSELYAIRVGLPAGRFWSFISCLVVMILPTTLMGASFPLVTRIYTLNLNQLGRSIGNVYSINTLGSIFGSFAAGFILIPLIGIQKSVILIASVNAIMGCLLIALNPQANKQFRLSGIISAVLIIIFSNLFMPTDKPIVLKSAIFKIQNPGGKLLSYEEGVDASVTAMVDADDVRRLYVDTNQAAEDSRWDSPSHRVIAHLPLLIHPRPKRALIVGFGMGVTSYSATQHGVTVDAVEISPGVVNANRYFTHVNGDVLKNPLVNLTVDDGRNYILTTENRYDMISTGIIHPLVSSGSSSIYSEDFYELCKRILTNDGIMCQWVPLHRLPEEYYKMIIRTFIKVFPHTTLWYKFTPDFSILIGTPERLRIDFSNFIARAQIPSVRKGLARDDLDSMSLLDSFMMSEETVRKYVGEGPIHTDDRPRLEFFGAIPPDTTSQNIRSMVRFRESVKPFLINVGETPEEAAATRKRLDTYFQATQYLIEGQIEYAEGKFEDAVDKFNTALNLNPDDKTIKYNLSVAAGLAREEIDEQMAGIEKQLLSSLKENPRSADTHRNLGVIYQSQGKIDKAIDSFKTSLRYNPRQPEIYLALGALYETKGLIDESIDAYKRVTQLEPTFAAAYGSLSALYERIGKLDEAIEANKKVIELEPNLWLAHSNLGSLYLSKGEYGEAIKSFKRAIELQSDSPAPYNNLGIVYTQQGKYDEAENAFKQAIKIAPDFDASYLNLSKLYVERDIQLDEAIKLARQAAAMNESAEAYDVLASAYFQKGMYKEALKEIDKAINLAPDEKIYREFRRRIEELSR
ncbi:TPA: tetratricopeptide repeat protein [Candidatus Poribacteria bacterium]|nr:tetratricopeptide repeat protein [Candidatus Poribacteria bacterium]